MPPRFQKHFQSNGSFRWWDTRTCRYYDAGQYELVAWLAAGNVPDEVAYTPPPSPAEDPVAVAVTAAEAAYLAAPAAPKTLEDALAVIAALRAILAARGLLPSGK